MPMTILQHGPELLLAMLDASYNTYWQETVVLGCFIVLSLKLATR